MRVIVDTSVWSLALRRREPIPSPEIDALLELIQNGDAVMIGAVRQEILSGVRHHEQFLRLSAALEAFPDEPISTEDYIEAARICNACLSKGISTGNTDCLIAAVAIQRGMQILTTDQDFVNMAKVVPLQLL